MQTRAKIMSSVLPVISVSLSYPHFYRLVTLGMENPFSKNLNPSHTAGLLRRMSQPSRPSTSISQPTAGKRRATQICRRELEELPELPSLAL